MDELLRVSVEDVDGVAVVHADGEVDVSTSPLLAEQLASVPAVAGELVIDLTEVTFLDSTGLGVLVACLKRCREQDPECSLRLVVSRPQLAKVLAVTGLDGVFAIFPTLEEALSA